MLLVFVSLFLPIEKSGPINKDDILIVDLILSINSFPVNCDKLWLNETGIIDFMPKFFII